MAGNSGSPEIDTNSYLVPSSSIQTGVTTVGTSAAVTLVVTPLSGRARVYVTNPSTFNCYVGASTVTASNGFPLVQNQPLPFPIGEALRLYVISDNGVFTIRTLELS